MSVAARGKMKILLPLHSPSLFLTPSPTSPVLHSSPSLPVLMTPALTSSFPPFLPPLIALTACHLPSGGIFSSKLAASRLPSALWRKLLIEAYRRPPTICLVEEASHQSLPLTAYHLPSGGSFSLKLLPDVPYPPFVAFLASADDSYSNSIPAPTTKVSSFPALPLPHSLFPPLRQPPSPSPTLPIASLPPHPPSIDISSSPSPALPLSLSLPSLRQPPLPSPTSLTASLPPSLLPQSLSLPLHPPASTSPPLPL